MSNIELSPYIFFKGNCAEAMEFYKKVFGGELSVDKYDTLPDGTPGKEEMKGKILNAVLKPGHGFVLRGSDSPKASPAAKKVTICLTGGDEAYLRKVFDSLSKGGSVFQKLEKMFWGDLFGSVTDKYGVEWMVDVNPKM